MKYTLILTNCQTVIYDEKDRSQMKISCIWHNYQHSMGSSLF